MVYVLRCPDNNGFNKSSIQTAIKYNRIYKGFRWNFVKEGEDPYTVNIEATNEYNSKAPIISTILELNSSKTEIMNSFYTKDYAAEHLKLSKVKMRNIVQNNELLNEKYYIEYHKCPAELIKNCKLEINRIIPNHAKSIKQIHPISNKTIIFTSLSEIYLKFGLCSKTLIEAIENKTVCSGFLWEYN